MANYNLAGQKIKNTYQQVAQVDGTTLVNGSGTATPIATSSIVNFPTEVSRSAAAAGFGTGGGAVWPVSGTPSGLISSSAQVNLSLATGTAANATSASYATNALSASYAPAASLPSGLVSSSAQISYTGITNVPSGIVSGAAQLPQIGTNTSNIASLTAATSSYLTSLPSGVISSSAQVNLASAFGTAANAVSASYAVTASYALNAGGGAGLVSGTGTNSMKSADTLTSVTASASGQDSIALGDNAVAESIGAISIGKNSEARGDYSVAIGYNADVFDNVRDYSTAIGAEARLAQNSVGVGYHAYGVGSDCIAIGMNSNVAGFAAVGIGVQAQAFANNAIAIGYQQQANNYNYEINLNGKLKYNSTNSGSFIMEGAVSIPTATLTAAGGVVSVDCGVSNFFTLAAGGVSATVSNPTNLMNGVTYTMKITNGQNLSWGTNYNFEGGVAPTLTSGTDIVSFASFGDGQLYCSYLLNLS